MPRGSLLILMRWLDRLKSNKRIYLNIFEVVMYVSNVSRVLDRQLLNGGFHRHQNCRLCSRPHSHESVIFIRLFGIHIRRVC